MNQIGEAETPAWPKEATDDEINFWERIYLGYLMTPVPPTDSDTGNAFACREFAESLQAPSRKVRSEMIGSVKDMHEPRTVPCAHCGGKGTIELAAEVTTVETYYFGCWRETGHHWHGPKRPSGLVGSGHGDIDMRVPKRLRNGRIDGRFCPGYIGPYKRDREEKEGEAALHHIDGWTVLAWWDNSIDNRSASNSAIVSKGLYDFTTMLEIGKAQMPHVMERQRTPIVLVIDETEFYEA